MTKFVIHNHLPARRAVDAEGSNRANDAGEVEWHVQVFAKIHGREDAHIKDVNVTAKTKAEAIKKAGNLVPAGEKFFAARVDGANDARDHSYRVKTIEGEETGKTYELFEGAGVDGGMWFVKHRGRTVFTSFERRSAEEWAEHS